ncbi:MAG: biopolymer transporter ExbD [Desulfobacterales bacterium]|nr:biopolymer transporter ExbD [Desulfobacterales bacterium]
MSKLSNRRKRQHEQAELNITTFLNLMVVLIPFLLVTAVFSRITILEPRPAGCRRRRGRRHAGRQHRGDGAQEPARDRRRPPGDHHDPQGRGQARPAQAVGGAARDQEEPRRQGRRHHPGRAGYRIRRRDPRDGRGPDDRGPRTRQRRDSEDRPVPGAFHRGCAVKNTRRLKRMARAKKHKASLNLTSLMDVFTILVFFLLVNQSAVEVLEPPREIKLPDSVVEAKPRQTLVIMVSEEAIMVQGEATVALADVLAMKDELIQPVIARLSEIRRHTIGLSTETVAKTNEVVILAHKTIPFKVLKKLMSTCAVAGYTKISLAVIQKGKQG